MFTIMIQLVFWYALISMSMCFSTIIETEVRLLEDTGEVVDGDSCGIIISRAQHSWEEGLFLDCQLTKTTLHEDGTQELKYRIKINETKLPVNYDKVRSYDFLMWHVNRLLNGQKATCLTASGVGQLKDSYSTYVLDPDYIPRDEYLLIAPYKEDLCQTITPSRFMDNQIVIDDCMLLDTSNHTVGCVVLGKYKLRMIDLRDSEASVTLEDPDMFLLKKLNEAFGQCEFNGYWAPAHKIFSVQVDLLSERNITDNGEGCKLLISSTPQLWNDNTFHDCFLFESVPHGRTDNYRLSFLVYVNETKLPKEYDRGQEQDVFIWYVNNQINGEGKQCHVASADPLALDVEDFDSVEDKKRLLIVGPYQEDLCDKLTDPSYKMKYPGLGACTQIDSVEMPGIGRTLDRYLIEWQQEGLNIEDDPRMCFLAYLNRNVSECAYNGYWTVPEALQSTVQEEVL